MRTSVALSTVEAVYLGCLLEAESLMGFPDPFGGWLTEEIEPALAAARDSLAARDVITLLDDGRIQVDPLAALVIRACGFSAASFLCNRTVGTETYTYALHLTPDAAVEQIPSDGDTVGYELTVLATTEDVPARIVQFLGLADQGAAEALEGEVPEAVLTKARTLAAEQGEESAAACLAQAGLSQATALALARAFARGASGGSLAALRRLDQSWAVDGIALLDGPDGLWLLRTGREGETVRVSPATAKEAMAEVMRIMAQSWPAPAAAS